MNSNVATTEGFGELEFSLGKKRPKKCLTFCRKKCRKLDDFCWCFRADIPWNSKRTENRPPPKGNDRIPSYSIVFHFQLRDVGCQELFPLDSVQVKTKNSGKFWSEELQRLMNLKVWSYINYHRCRCPPLGETGWLLCFFVEVRVLKVGNARRFGGLLKFRGWVLLSCLKTYVVG